MWLSELSMLKKVPTSKSVLGRFQRDLSLLSLLSFVLSVNTVDLCNTKHMHARSGTFTLLSSPSSLFPMTKATRLLQTNTTQTD